MNEIDNAAFCFFKAFSSTEYALKAAGYLENKKDGEEAKADWDRFAIDAEGFIEKVSDDNFSIAREFLLTRPPKKQIVKDGTVAWKDTPASRGSPTKDLFVYIRRVRNNLFHGGKYDGKIWMAAERSLELFQHSLTILEKCLSSHPELIKVHRDPS
jgi:hypothetical protein